MSGTGYHLANREGEVNAGGLVLRPDRVERGHQLGRGDDGVVAARPRHPAAVRVLADAARVEEPRVAADAGDHAHGDRGLVEHGPLLDVYLTRRVGWAGERRSIADRDIGWQRQASGVVDSGARPQGPCSTHTSMQACRPDGGSETPPPASIAAGSPPDARMCSATLTPLSTRVAASSSARRVPSALRAPMNGTPNHSPSSPRIPTTLTSRAGTTPASRSAQTTTSPATTPAAPSKLPPRATESRWDSTTTGGAARSAPGSVIRVFPAASTSTWALQRP